jgi:hypothetical protein
MTTLEQEQPFLGPAAPEHVFASANGRRARFVRVAGGGAGVLAVAWLVALGLAILGAAGIPDTLRGAKSQAPAAARATNRAEVFRRVVRTHRGALAPQAPAAAPPRRHGQAPTTAPAARPAPGTAAPVKRSVASSAAVAPTAAVTTAAPRKGWARRGWTAPPGQTKTKPRPRRDGSSTDSPAANVSHGQSGSHSPPKG